MSVFKEDKYNVNKPNVANGLDFIDNINNETIKTVFFDPQYRGILDKMKYGNEGESRGKARCDLPQMDEDTIKKFIKGIDRVMLPSGHLFLWVDKFHLCNGLLDWLAGTEFNLVDVIVWDKGKIGMGYRTRRKSEYLAIFQKSPVRAKGCWTLHNIPDVWEEKTPKKHPHSKPVDLQTQLILATTEPNDYILDPASGGYSVLDASIAAGNRNFVGCDLIDYK